MVGLGQAYVYGLVLWLLGKYIELFGRSNARGKPLYEENYAMVLEKNMLHNIEGYISTCFWSRSVYSEGGKRVLKKFNGERMGEGGENIEMEK